MVKSYADALETIDPDGERASVLNKSIPSRIWKRNIAEGATDDVSTGGTVRLAASDLIGGNPPVDDIGIGFHVGDLQRMIE